MSLSSKANKSANSVARQDSWDVRSENSFPSWHKQCTFEDPDQYRSWHHFWRCESVYASTSYKVNKALGLDHFFVTAQEPMYRHIDGCEALGHIRKVSICYAIVFGYNAVVVSIEVKIGHQLEESSTSQSLGTADMT